MLFQGDVKSCYVLHVAGAEFSCSWHCLGNQTVNMDLTRCPNPWKKLLMWFVLTKLWLLQMDYKCQTSRKLFNRGQRGRTFSLPPDASCCFLPAEASSPIGCRKGTATQSWSWATWRWGWVLRASTWSLKMWTWPTRYSWGTACGANASLAV